MLKAKSQEQVEQSPQENITELIPDPWLNNNPIDTSDSITSTLQSWKEKVVEEIPKVFTLPASKISQKINPIQVLLQDELKIKAFNSGTLKEHLQQAVVLLLWMGSKTPENTA